EQERTLQTSDWSPEGRRFLTAGEIGYFNRFEKDPKLIRSIWIWDTETGKLLQRIDVDLSAKEIRDSSDWAIRWLDAQTLLLQLYARMSPARTSVGTILGLVDVGKGKVTRMSGRLGIRESLTFSPDRKRAITTLEYGVWRVAGGDIGTGGWGT